MKESNLQLKRVMLLCYHYTNSPNVIEKCVATPKTSEIRISRLPEAPYDDAFAFNNRDTHLVHSHITDMLSYQAVSISRLVVSRRHSLKDRDL